MTTSHHVTAPPPLAGDDSEDVHVGKLAVRLANVVVFPMVLKSVLELGVIDVLRDAGEGVMLSVLEIAKRISAGNPGAPELLDRMLRLLASYGVVKGAVRESAAGEPERVYGAGPICQFLGMKEEEGGGEGSIAPLFLLHHDKVFMQSWLAFANLTVLRKRHLRLKSMFAVDLGVPIACRMCLDDFPLFDIAIAA